jgi:8-oxo-dGTP pyrophosphatase MutT (NUDIX family)
LASRANERFAADEAAASVLVPILVDRRTGTETLLLTKRTETLPTHKGQVSFPGGFREPHDPDLLATALREAEEEVGIAPADVRILGALDPVVAGGRVGIRPFVAVLDAPYAFRPSVDEVERLLELPVERLVLEGLRTVTVPVGPVQVKSEGILVDGELVWGATARMLRYLYELLNASVSPTKSS